MCTLECQFYHTLLKNISWREQHIQYLPFNVITKLNISLHKQMIFFDKSIYMKMQKLAEL